MAAGPVDNASPIVDKLLAEPALAPMGVAFDDELAVCLLALLTGLEHAAAAG